MISYKMTTATVSVRNLQLFSLLKLFSDCFAVFLCLSVSMIMVALWNRADHYIFALWFLLSLYLSFFRRLILAVADWMSATRGVALVRI